MTEPLRGNSYASDDGERLELWRREGFPRPLILGHRGSPREALENTLRSFDLALRAGADGVELDIQVARDGAAVVVHDESLDRVLGISATVSALDWPAIERVTAAQVPSFGQVVAWAAASGAWVNVELKAAGAEEKVVQAIRRTGIAERIIISSFDHESVKRAGSVGPELRRYLLTERWDSEAEERYRAADAAGVCLRADASTPATLALLTDRRIPVVVWTVNEAGRVRELLEAGVVGIISDEPAMAAAERDRMFPL